MDGIDLVEYICKLLEIKDVRCHDGAIVNELSRLTRSELLKLLKK